MLLDQWHEDKEKGMAIFKPKIYIIIYVIV